jgi:hypothetical protein
MKSITICFQQQIAFGLAIDNTKAADSNYPKGYYECLSGDQRPDTRNAPYGHSQAPEATPGLMY